MKCKSCRLLSTIVMFLGLQLVDLQNHASFEWLVLLT